MFSNVRSRHTSGFRLLIVTAVSLLLATTACAGRSGGKDLLPRATATAAPAPYQPDQAFTAQTDGALARPVFRGADDGPVRAEIVDVLVPPGRNTTLKYDGLIVAELKEGEGSTTVQGKPVPLAAGSTFGLSHGDTAVVDNRGKEPLVLRVYIVSIR